jgi:hypothetical protein
MKSHLVFFLVINLLVMTAISSVQGQTNSGSPKVLRHVVMLKFKDSATPENVKTVEAGFAALAGKIKLIKGFEWGKNSSPENMNQGLTHCFFVTFSSDKDRDAYLIHPDHKAFVEGVLLPYLDKATIVDYWTEK